MPTETRPPTYPFSFVLEYRAPLAPHLSRLLAGLYSEPSRSTCFIQLSGKGRHVAFVTHRASRDRAHKLGWRDVTATFFAEWENVNGEWRRASVTAPPPIREPDRKPPPTPTPEADPLEMSVKDLLVVVQRGDLDTRLSELLEREKQGDNGTGRARGGAVAGLTARLALLVGRAGGAGPAAVPSA